MTLNCDLKLFYAQRSPNSALRTNGVADKVAMLSNYTCALNSTFHLLSLKKVKILYISANFEKELDNFLTVFAIYPQIKETLVVRPA